MLSRFKFTPPLGRLTVSQAVLTLASLGLASPGAIAAETSPLPCAEAAPAGSKRVDAAAPGEQPGGSGAAAAAPQGATGLRVYIDPETGEFTTPPSDVRAAESAAAAATFSTSHEGLVETPSPVSGGGVLLDLKGRFRSPLIATVDAEGRVEMRHGPCPRTSEEGK